MIGLNDFRRQWRETREDALAAFIATGESGWYVLGREVQQFESALAEYWELQHAVGVASGLDAIEIALRAAGCKPGDKVLTTPISAFATTLAIIKIGAEPVFADTDAFGLIDLDLARDVIRQNPRIRYFVPVHLYGYALDAERLGAIKHEFGATIIEDCAQSIGAQWKGMPTGAVGFMAATSFYPTKNLGAMGDGGAILTNNEESAQAARVLRDYGQSNKYRHDVVGYNSRLDELQAALLTRVSLPRLDRWTERRKELAAAYIAGIQNRAVRVLGSPVDSASCWHLFPVLVSPNRKPDFITHLRKRGIGAGEHYPIAIPDQKALSGVPCHIASNGIEQARLFCRSEVSLPIHPYLCDSEISAVLDAVNEWVN
ncbi:MAG: DegT/DnrJ/EryC1/StrS family aminotransferase [Acidobacteriota bacterium]|nr:DegT/DnrJ/EryC1/StrS family aminotransferase [Acidobacteriota bacterium]